MSQSDPTTGALEDWFERRTFRADQFDLDDLAARKASEGLTVSAVLPAKDEVETVAGVVGACTGPAGVLVDEIVVMDAASTDGTARVAAEAGATVCQDSDVLSGFGPSRGKGDALWRSLEVTSGDILLFIDTDIRNPDPRFVYGLLGPLLHDPAISFVKAFYDRPVRLEETLHPTGGGRVTELLARPLLNLYWPELAGMVQPLSGEYAGRRGLLESVPFFTGYGVELGLLIDVACSRGVDTIAQVDLLERVHRNQTIDSLSRMAFGILQVAHVRLALEDGRTVLVPSRYVQFAREDDRVTLDLREFAVTERPPARTLRS